MRTKNPMLKSEAFKKAQGTGSVMTISGTVGKTVIMLLLLLGTAVYSYVQFLNNKMNMTVAISALIIAAVVALITIFVPRISPITAPIYAAVEGVILGTLSAMFAVKFGDQIILQAVLLTVSILFGLLLLYATRVVKVGDKFRTGVFAATLGVAIMYLVVMVLHLFNVPVPFLHQGGTISIIISAVLVVIASLNLLLDFDFIEEGARQGSPKYMEWYGALGLMLTLVWLYVEILRLVSYFTKNN